MRTATLSALLLCLTASTAASAGVVGRATLQVRAEPGYDAVSVSRILTDGGYLGSVTPGMVSWSSFAGDEIGEGVTVLSAVAAGNEILTLTLHGADEATTRAHLAALLENLTSIVPTRRADALQDLKTAEETLALAQDEYEETRARLSAFVEENGAVEPTVWLNTHRGSLQQRDAELRTLDLDVASARALRDYLAATIEETPERITTQISQEVQEAKEELVRIRKALSDQQETRSETHPDVRQAREKVAEAEKKLEHLRAAAEATGDARNPRRIRLEQELFEVERDLALSESRRRELKAYVDELRDEAKRLALLESEWRDLREQVEMAEGRLFNARNQLDNARVRARQALATEWATVIAGPTFAGE